MRLTEILLTYMIKYVAYILGSVKSKDSVIVLLKVYCINRNVNSSCAVRRNNINNVNAIMSSQLGSEILKIYSNVFSLEPPEKHRKTNV